VWCLIHNNDLCVDFKDLKISKKFAILLQSIFEDLGFFPHPGLFDDRAELPQRQSADVLSTSCQGKKGTPLGLFTDVGAFKALI